MANRAKILIVDSNLHSLSKIYLSLIHRNYKVEASDNAQEIMPRTERFKPRLIILNTATHNLTQEIYSYLAKKVIQVLLIADKPQEASLESWRWEAVQMPSDMTFFDDKIREMLSLIE